ncbi:hypothetical protein ANCCEY_13133 [Ancylostoma ceylanicum]|uniref:Akirin n=1 Tax=Ancylostoma ceylanicum TaxID=53326 RepID=A0A0D6LD60_9BILA|nr:hypothetical protein ANCCEY_13133 [Ancylostoma ceylanicum]
MGPDMARKPRLFFPFQDVHKAKPSSSILVEVNCLVHGSEDIALLEDEGIAFITSGISYMSPRGKRKGDKHLENLNAQHEVTKDDRRRYAYGIVKNKSDALLMVMAKCEEATAAVWKFAEIFWLKVALNFQANSHCKTTKKAVFLSAQLIPIGCVESSPRQHPAQCLSCKSGPAAQATQPEMACGLALKRPHEYDSYLADESFPHEAKRARQTAAHCSPFRPQMGTIAANLPSTSSFAQAANKDDSPFAAVAGKCQLSESQLDAYLRSEVRSGQRRKLLPRRSCIDVKVEDENTPRKDYRTPNSPPQSGSDSEGESTSIRKSSTNSYQALAEKPQFSLKQVRIICERLLKEQEMRLRYEYELALNQKLDEQHEQYVQFASEQMASQYKENSAGEFSYLS